MADCGCTIDNYCPVAASMKDCEDRTYAASQASGHDPRLFSLYEEAAAIRRGHRDRALRRGRGG